MDVPKTKMRHHGPVHALVMAFVLWSVSSWVSAASSMAGGALPAHPPVVPVTSFESGADWALVSGQGATVALSSEHATQGQQALKIGFAPNDWSWQRASITPAAPWDWSGAGILAFDAANPGDAQLMFRVSVDDDLAARPGSHRREGVVKIPAHSSGSYSLTFDPKTPYLGMRGLPTWPGLRDTGMREATAIDSSHVVRVMFSMATPAEPRTVFIDNLRLLPSIPLSHLVDAYGQSTLLDYPGKINREAELVARREAEAADLRAHPAAAERDRFGGWSAGPQLHASGFFRTEKFGGHWWLVDPDGRLFFSTGMDTMSARPADNAMFTGGREELFNWLPTKDEPLGQFYGGAKAFRGPVPEAATYNFLAANLQRKYGEDWNAAWRQVCLARLSSWGMNTVGIWSDFLSNHQVPYIATVSCHGDHARVSDGHDQWGAMHDPFDPQFAADVARNAAETMPSFKNDPLCLGYFVDNELAWGGEGARDQFSLAYGALAAAAAASPAKREFLRQLKAKYGEVMALNRAWATSFDSWEGLEAPVKLDGIPGTELRADLGAFLRSFAEQYFRVVRDALKANDPNHLYLGCRFMRHGLPIPEAAAAKFCDVVSFNIYEPLVDPHSWADIAAYDKPCLIGEFSIGTSDRGRFHYGIVPSVDENQRAEQYKTYVRSALDNPSFVGCHWFQYLDEPLLGRTYDGENYNFGFVTVTDTPYPEMVSAAREVGAEMYRRRFGMASK